MKTLMEAINFLELIKSNWHERDSEPVWDLLKQIKDSAVEKGDEKQANEIWCFQKILKIQEGFILCYHQMKADLFYKAWCTLEQIELAQLFLDRHFQDNENRFALEYIREKTEKLQSLYPYKIFLSTEILELDKVCSICRQKIGLRSGCEHRLGELYQGKNCSHIVTKCKMFDISLVYKPVNKYAVPFMVDGKSGEQVDHYNYSPVRYLIKRLRNPFHNWDVQWCKRRMPHEYFKSVGRNEECPCGSGIKYKKCCLVIGDGVLRPHCEFIFSVPPQEAPNIEYHA